MKLELSCWMLSQKQLEIKNLVFLINANPSGCVPWEADSNMKSNMQEGYWGCSWGQHCRREGKGRVGKEKGLHRRKSWLWCSHDKGPRQPRGSCRAYLGQEGWTLYPHGQPVRGCRLLQGGSWTPVEPLHWVADVEGYLAAAFPAVGGIEWVLPEGHLGRASQHPLQLVVFYSNVTELYLADQISDQNHH